MIITVTKSAYVHRRIFSLLCVLLIFIAILPISAFADWVTVSTVNSASYFQTFSSKGVWTAIGTPAHYINETGQVAYCLQTNYNSPNNSGYSSTSGWQYYDETTIRGLQSILEHGYPNDDGGFSADEARYATANAIRFWLAERGAEGVPDWMNLQLYSQFFRGAPGYEYLFQWCMYLLENARYQVTYDHSVSFSPITLTEDLLTAYKSLWRRMVWKCGNDGFDFQAVHLRGIRPELYSVYQAAKAIAVGSSNITLADLASPELVTDEAFYLIICALLMAKYGVVILNLENG